MNVSSHPKHDNYTTKLGFDFFVNPTYLFFMENPVFRKGLSKGPTGVYCPTGRFFTVKTPCGNLVQRSLLRARLCPISLIPQISEVIIRKNTGTGPELLTNPRWERMGSNMAMLQRPKTGGVGVWEATGTAWDMPGSSSEDILDKKEFYRVKKSFLSWFACA